MQSQSSLNYWRTGLLLLVLVACSDEPASAPGTSDLGAVEDTQSGDGTSIDIAGLNDASTGEDAIVGPQCDSAPYPSGCPCLEADECDEGFCVVTEVGQICVEACVDTCPKGFTCTGTGSGSDQIFLCLPRFAKLCQPCTEHLDCQSTSDPQLSLCLNYGAGGNFCGGYCESTASCPSGYHCENIDLGDGTASQQCRKTDQNCACNKLGSTLAMKTECVITNAHGACGGERYCAPTGLSKCDAVPAQSEICDGKDNDCDGDVDDIGTEVPCDVENDFGACPGVLVCVGGVGKCLGDVPQPELCDGLDNDCDGENDEIYPDTDGDGLADCVDPDDDGDEIPDELDNCPKVPNKDQADLDDDSKGDMCDGDPDGDNFPGDSDCGPMDSQIHPGAEEKCNGKDDDCNGKVDDKVCEDGVACTFDFCDPVTVTCNHAPDPSACSDGNDCTEEVCDLTAGCSSTPNTGNDCNDGNDCTFGDTCSAGVCSGTPQGNCCLTSADCNDNNSCTADLCDLSKGTCTHLTVEDGTSCNADDSGCSSGDSCKLGTCVAGPPVVCAGGSGCVQTVCESTGISTYLCNSILANEQTLCDDGLYCTVGDHCDGLGTCVSGAQSICNEPPGGCQLSFCNEAAKKCILISQPDGTPCNADESGCTQSDSCLGAVCIPGPQPDCGSLDSGCVVGTCESLGAEFYKCSNGYAPKGVACDDSLYCTVNETCDGLGGCGGGVPKNCSKEIDDACVTGFCDEFATACKPINKVDGTACDDGEICTLGDSCNNGTCTSGDSACVEEQISTTNNGGKQVFLAHLGSGRYVTQWTGDGISPGDNSLRLSDAYGSRENEEEYLAGDASTEQFASRITVGSGGAFVAVHWGASECQCSKYVKCGCDFGDVYARKYSYDGNMISESKFDQNHLFVAHNASQNAVGIAKTTHATAVPLGFSNNTWAIIKGEEYSLTGPKPQLDAVEGEIRFVVFDAGFNVGNSLLLVTNDKLINASYFDACKRQNNNFLLAWLGTGNSVNIREFQQTGVPISGVHTAAVVSGGTITQIRIACAKGTDQKHVVLWQLKENSSSKEIIYGRRYNSIGTPNGQVFVATNSNKNSNRLGDVAYFSNTNFVVAYEAEGGDLDGSAIKAQRWSSSGGLQGGAISINSASAGDQSRPGVEVMQDDEFVVAFSDSENRVFTRRFDSNGGQLTGRPELTANSTVLGDQRAPAAAIAGTGKMVLSYQSPVAGKEDNEILARIVNAKGELVGAEFQVNTHTPGNQFEPSAAGASNRLAIAWTSTGQDGSQDGVYLRLLDGQGAFISAEIGVNQETAGIQRTPATAVDSNGNTVVVWIDQSGEAPAAVRSRRFDPNGDPLTGELQIDESGAENDQPAIANIAGTEAFIVAFETGTNVSAVAARKIGYGGVIWSNQVQVNSTQTGAHQRPTIAISNDGKQAALCWDTDANAAIMSRKVFCRLIETDGMTSVSNEFSPHAAVGGMQWRPSITSLATGDYLLAWSAQEVDGSEAAIHYRRITTGGLVAGPRIVANRHWEGEQTSPSIVATPGGSFIVTWQTDTKDGDENGISLRMMPPP